MNENEIWELLNRPVKDALRDDVEFKQFVDELRNAGLSQQFTNYLHRFVSEVVNNVPVQQSTTYNTYEMDGDDRLWLESIL